MQSSHSFISNSHHSIPISLVEVVQGFLFFSDEMATTPGDFNLAVTRITSNMKTFEVWLSIIHILQKLSYIVVYSHQ